MTVALALTGIITEPLCAQRLLDHGYARSVVFSPDGNTFVSLGAGGIKFWTLRGKLTATLKTTEFGNLAFSPDGKTLAVGHRVGVTLWKIDPSPKEPKEIVSIKDDAGRDDGAYSCHVAFSPDGGTLAWRGQKSVTLWNVKDRKTIEIVKVVADSLDSGISFSRDSKNLSWATREGIVIWNVDERKPAKFIKVESRGTPSFNPQEDMLAWRDDSGVTLWDTKTHEKIDYIKTKTPPRDTGPVFSHDGKRLAVIHEYKVEVFDVKSGLSVFNCNHNQHRRKDNGETAKMIAFSRDGSILAICDGTSSDLSGDSSGIQFHYIGQVR
jgi:WD40 repeat protein